MTHLTQAQLDRLVDALDSRQAALTALVQEHVAQLRESTDPLESTEVGDSADVAQVGIVRDSENAAVSRDIRELREIEATRERIAGGEHGVCIDCGDEIAFERLIAYPTALRCVECQSRYERTHAQIIEPAAREEGQ